MGRHGVSAKVAGTVEDRIGFYGCADEVVRLRLRGGPRARQRYPKRVRLDCPSCGHNHDVQPLWRKVIPVLDKGKEVTYI